MNKNKGNEPEESTKHSEVTDKCVDAKRCRREVEDVYPCKKVDLPIFKFLS